MVARTPNLYDLAVAYRAGDIEAGWAFAMSPQMRACINYWCGYYKKFRHVTHEDIEDLRADLTSRIVEMLGNTERLRLPDYEQDSWNEGALVAWFRRALQGMSRKAVHVIVNPRLGRMVNGQYGEQGVAYADIPFSQMLNGVRYDEDESSRIITEDHVNESFLNIGADPDPIQSLDAARRTNLLALMQRHFSCAEESRIAYEALLRYEELGSWTKVAVACGLPRGKDRTIKTAALRLRNLIKITMLDLHEDVRVTTLAVYTSVVDAGITLMKQNGTHDVWVYRNNHLRTVRSFAKRIRTILDDEDITFAVLNMDDEQSAFRHMSDMTLERREPVVERIDIRWLDTNVCGRVKTFARIGDPRRLSMLMAHAKKAECELLMEGAA